MATFTPVDKSTIATFTAVNKASVATFTNITKSGNGIVAGGAMGLLLALTYPTTDNSTFTLLNKN